MHLGPLDAIVFIAYFAGVVLFGVWVAARSKNKSASSFFLASKKLPWYAVGASFIAANISTEHFIGMIGWSYLYGMAVSHWSWLNGATFTILIWVFLPFYMRGNVTTMPEFLERRYNRWCRRIYAVVSIAGMVIAMLGGVMFAGGKAINAFFPMISVEWGIVILAVAAGTYTVYGGLLSAAWADFVQYCLLMIAGFCVLFFGLYYAGGWTELARELPEKFVLFYPPTHEQIPWTGIATALFTVGIWYSSANQFMVQRCLGARSEWDARMGVVMSGFSQALMPFIVVVPGFIAFYLFHAEISDGDQSWPMMVRAFLPSGLIGLVLAGLASAVMSTLSAITTSSSTIIAHDLYRPLLRPNCDDRELHLVGRLACTAVLLIGVVIALVMANVSGITVFGVIQQVFFYSAGPISITFLLGILWPRVTPAAATWALVLGFCAFFPGTVWAFGNLAPLQPYDNFIHHTFVVWLLSGAVLLSVSAFTKPKTAEELKGVIWNRNALGFVDAEGRRLPGKSSLIMAWATMVMLIVALYIYTYSIGSGAIQLEAENLTFTAQGGQARVQARSEISKTESAFNLWANAAQVFYQPEAEGDTLVLSARVPEVGRYRVAAVVTRGDDYGAFGARVNDQPVEIVYSETVTGGEPAYRVVKHATDVFEAYVDNPQRPGEPRHVVSRIELGTHILQPPIAEVAFVARRDEPNRRFIGVDQIILVGPLQEGEEQP